MYKIESKIYCRDITCYFNVNIRYQFILIFILIIIPILIQSTNTSLSDRTLSIHTPLRDGQRKRTLSERSEKHSSNDDSSVTGTARCDVEIAEVNPLGRFVKLTNKSNEVRLKEIHFDLI